LESGAALGDLVIADDDVAFLDLLVKAFRRDFTVHAAPDGARAMALLEQTHPSAVLVDEMMPFHTGTEVLAAARVRHPHAARMLMTASTAFERAVGAVNQGQLHRFFSKPVRPLELRAAVLEVVERTRTEALLHVELETLSALKAPAVPHVRALLAGLPGPLEEQVRAACQQMGHQVFTENGSTLTQVALANRAVDLLVVGVEVGSGLRQVVHTARTLDESVAVVLVEEHPSLESAVVAHELGVNDYLAPLPATALLGNRLERALHSHLVHKDMQRVQRELLVANRNLALARRKQEEQQFKVLRAMVRALEARDAYTAGHTDRVAAIAVRVSQVLDLTADRVENVRIGALLHDIGKIGVPDAVLLKPGRLTPEEFEVIKKHTTLGYNLLSDVDQFRCVAPIVKAHHERLDGSGYPDKLMAQDIPMEARIVAVADITDAITSTRPYRQATGVDSVFDVLGPMEGKALDATVVDALRSLHRQGRLADLLQGVEQA
jgi:putative nucleotidyltransferase with HDIG domain